MPLSEKSRDFLEHLRVYLIASGKNEEEVNSIVTELEDHLREAEKKGKSIDHIVGSSPKEYMESLAKEMPFDYVSAIKYIPLVIIGFLSFVVLGDALRSGIDYSWIKLIGYPVAALFLMAITMGTFKFLSARQVKEGKQVVVLSGLGVFNIVVFLFLLYLSKNFGEPVLVLDKTGNLLVGIVAAMILTGIAVMAKIWIPVLVPLFFYGPELILKLEVFQKLHNWDEATTALVGIGIGNVLVLIYSLLSVWMINKKEAAHE